MGAFSSTIPSSIDDCHRPISRLFPQASKETGQVKPAKVGFTWRLENFEKMFIETPNGPFVSPSFGTLDGKDKWSWRLILHCGLPSDLIRVSIEMLLHDSVPVITPWQNFWLRSIVFRVGYHLTGISTRGGKRINIFRTDHMVFPEQDNSWCCKQFINKNIFVSDHGRFTSRNLLIKDVSLSIFCEGFICGRGRALPSRRELWESATFGALSGAFADFSSLYEDRRLSDFSIRIDDGSIIPVHKLIFAARSRVFAAMLQHDMSESQNNELVMKGARRVVLEKLLQYVYCGIVKDIDDVNLELLVLAHRYEMTKLKDICEISMLDSLTIDIALELLVIADMYETPILKQKAIFFINMNAKRVMQTKGFVNMAKLYPDLFVELFENQVDYPTGMNTPTEVVIPSIEFSDAEEAFFTYDDLRKDFAASDRKPDKR